MIQALLLLILCAANLAAQSTTSITLAPKQDGTTGTVVFKELYSNGNETITHRAPASITASYTITDPPAPPSTNQCAVFDGSAFVYRNCTGQDYLPASYNFSYAPGGSLSVGTNTVSFTPCPNGVNGTDIHHGLRISGGTGTAETVKITGGTCTSGATTGTLQFSAAYTHSGAYTIASNSAGFQEAIIAAIAGSGRVFLPLGRISVGPPAPGEVGVVYISGPVTIVGSNATANQSSEIYVTSNTFAIVVGTGADGGSSVNLANFRILGSGMSTGGGLRFTSDTVHNCYSVVQNLQLHSLPVGIDFEKGCEAQIHSNIFYGYTSIGLRLRNTYSTDIGSHYISNNSFLISGSGVGTKAISWESGAGNRIVNNKFTTTGTAIDITLVGPSSGATISGNSFENQSETSVKVRGTSGFVNFTATGNIVLGAGGIAYKAFDIGDDTTDAISNVVISGNSMQASGTAIKIGNVSSVYIGENVLGSFTTGIDLKATASNVTLGKHTIYSVTTPLTYALVSSIRSNSLGISSGYVGWASSNTNTKIIHHFEPPATGEVNNAIIFGTNTPGDYSQRGIGWNSAARMYLGRFPSNRTINEAEDLILDANGLVISNYGIGVFKTPTGGTALDAAGIVRANNFNTQSNCVDAAGTIDCGSASAGSFALAAGTTGIQVNTTAVSANSQIFIQNDPSLASRLGVTCNSTFADTYILSRGAGVGFVILTAAAPVTNPRCYSFFIVN